MSISTVATAIFIALSLDLGTKIRIDEEGWWRRYWSNKVVQVVANWGEVKWWDHHGLWEAIVVSNVSLTPTIFLIKSPHIECYCHCEPGHTQRDKIQSTWDGVRHRRQRLRIDIKSLEVTFDAKEAIIEALNHEVQLVRISIAQANKRSFWALLSSPSIIVIA